MIKKYTDEHKEDSILDKQLRLIGYILHQANLKGMTESVFAKALNKRPSEITKWKRGHNFTIETLFEIEKVLQISICPIWSPSPTRQSEPCIPCVIT